MHRLNYGSFKHTSEKMNELSQRNKDSGVNNERMRQCEETIVSKSIQFLKLNEMIYFIDIQPGVRIDEFIRQTDDESIEVEPVYKHKRTYNPQFIAEIEEQIVLLLLKHMLEC